MSVILRNPAAEALSPSARKKVAVIGGGIAGLTCAKRLDKNFDVTVFDTGRLRPGGRASSRSPGDKPKDPDDRCEFLSQCIVDHAAQVLAVSSGMSNFAEQIRVWEQQGVVAPFPPASLYAITADEKGPTFMNLSDQYYAVGGMSQLSRALCRDASFDVRQDQWVSPSNGVRFVEKTKQWKVQGCREPFDYLVIAHNGKCADRLMSRTPAKDVHKLLRVNFSATVPAHGGKRMTLNSIYSVTFALSKNSMLSKALPSTFRSGYVRNNPQLRFLTNQSRKHASDLDNVEVWTVLSSPIFAKKFKGPQEFLPGDLCEDVSDRLLRSLGQTIGLPEESLHPLEQKVQLWGAGLPLNTWENNCGFIWDETNSVGVCGDWLVEPSIAGAYESGFRLAEHLLRENRETAGFDGKWKLSRSATEAGIGALTVANPCGADTSR